jgi:catechol 2,3-dioxygenase-like lactoylglutathione lyase family enzyme
MHEPYFHIGILVRDVEAARAAFTAKLGVEFEPVRSQQLATGETTRFCYSLQGPPYLEVVEMTGTGSWSPDQPEGFHHIGVSDPSVPARCTAFDSGVDVIAPGPDGSPLVALTPPEALHGVRIEYFDAKVAARFLGYLSSRPVGSLSGGLNPSLPDALLLRRVSVREMYGASTSRPMRRRSPPGYGHEVVWSDASRDERFRRSVPSALGKRLWIAVGGVSGAARW